MQASLQRLGKYRLIRRLAVGGMAEIYEAMAEGLGDFSKPVVVKRLLEQHARDQDVLAMFVDEARLLARLRHPNIAEVYDIGHEGDVYYFALEHVRGVDLRDLLQAAAGRPLPLSEVLWVLIHVAEGLDHAHALADDDGKPLGIVHRDVSPSNVLIAENGDVKLIDFGVAKWNSQRSETRHGTIKGKVNYMSPEQCRTETLDRRSDVFALGVLLYEATTGKKPFAAAGDFDVLSAIVDGRLTPPGRIQDNYDAGLEAIVLRALARDRDARFQSAGDLAAALRSFAQAQGIVLRGDAVAKRVVAIRKERLTAGADLPFALGLPPYDRAAPTADRTLTQGPLGGLASSASAPTRTSASAIVRAGRRRMIIVAAGLTLVAASSVAAWALRDRAPVTGPGSAPPTAAPVSDPAPAVVTPPAPPAADSVVDVAASAVTSPEKPKPAGRPAATVKADTLPPKAQDEQAPAAAAATSAPVPGPVPTPPPAAKAPKVWDPDSPIPP